MENHILALLNGHLFSDAIRLAEIYHAETNTEDSLYYFALCYFNCKKINSAYHILSQSTPTHPKCRLLLGQCCFELSKYHEAEKALVGTEIKVDLLTHNVTSTTTSLIKEQLVKLYGNDSSQSAAIAAKYLGSIFEKTSRFKEAIEFFKISLTLFPYIWGSAEALSRLADKLSPAFSRTNFLGEALKEFRPDVKNQGEYFSHQIGVLGSNTFIDKSTPSNQDYKTPQTRRLPGPVKKEPRRSTRLYSIENETPAARPTIAGGANAPAKKRFKGPDPEPLTILNPTAKIFLETFKGLDCLNQYNLEGTLTALKALPDKHKRTAWVLSCEARAYYEKTDYAQSAKLYEEARKLEPYRLEGMEYYSTSLWHLHKEVELSILARELMEFEQNAPETLCVAGNCYSLQKEHESAIKYLERAIKVNPNFAYAYTLLGHELMSAEKLDQAVTYFRNAVRLDPRHWSAWCGLGCIYYKNEQYMNAELYYKRALKIAPSNPVLMCQLAVVQHACKRSDAAIETLTKALQVDENNALCRFHKATIYSAIDKNDKALAELEELKKLVPKESMVYFLIGKIHKKIGNTHTALMNFSWAMELDPKGANNTIKDVIDKQHSSEDDVVVHRDQCVDA